jgi:hypothetical protein
MLQWRSLTNNFIDSELDQLHTRGASMARGGYGRCFCVIYNTAGQLFDCEAQPSVMPAHFVRPQPAGQVAPHHYLVFQWPADAEIPRLSAWLSWSQRCSKSLMTSSSACFFKLRCLPPSTRASKASRHAANCSALTPGYRSWKGCSATAASSSAAAPAASASSPCVFVAILARQGVGLWAGAGARDSRKLAGTSHHAQNAIAPQ